MSLATVSLATETKADVRVKSAPPAPAFPNESRLVAAILAVTALVYAGALRYEFVYDDHGVIVNNGLVQSWRFVPQYFRGQLWQNLVPDDPGNYYRPLYILWLRLNDAIFGLHPAGWHATAILLHLTATFLAYCVARRLTGRPLVAAATALIFGVHPMHHEVVAWISSTSETIWSVLFLLAFLVYLKSRPGDCFRWMFCSCALYGAALLSKEPAVMLPGIVFVHAWIYGGEMTDGVLESGWQRLSKAAGLAAVYVPVFIAYLALRIHVLHGFQHPRRPIPLRTLALTLPSVVFFYVKQWLLPIRLVEFYNLPLRASFDLAHVLAPALALLALVLTVWFARRKLGPREVGFAALWTGMLLLPAFNIALFPPAELVHDRYFYLPSFGASMLLGLALEKLAHGVPPIFELPRRWVLAMLPLLVLLSYSTANAASYWVNDYVLFEHAYKLTPTNPTVRINYAIALAHNSDYGSAMKILQQLLKEEPTNPLANYNMGGVYYDLGLMGPAESFFVRSVQLDPRSANSYLQLGLVDLKIGRLDLAEQNLRSAAGLRPADSSFQFALGVALAARGNCVEARSEFAKALELKPNFPQAQEQMNKCGTGTSGAQGRPLPGPLGGLAPVPSAAPTGAPAIPGPTKP